MTACALLFSECNDTTRRERGKSRLGAEAFLLSKRVTGFALRSTTDWCQSILLPVTKGQQQKANVRSENRKPMRCGPFASCFVVVVVVFFIFIDIMHVGSLIPAG